MSEPWTALIKAGDQLSFAAQTSGGTAGRDETLVKAIESWSKCRDAFLAVERIKRLEPPGTIIGAVGGAVSQPAPHLWPNGCIKPNACSRHRMCVYAMTVEQCQHVGRNIGPEVDAETERRASVRDRSAEGGETQSGSTEGKSPAA